MRNLLLVIFLTSLTLVSVSQKPTKPFQSVKEPPLILVDSIIRISSMAYIDPDNISNIQVEKTDLDKKTGTNGKVFISSKHPCKLLSLNEIIKQYNVDVNMPLLFIVGNDVISDTSYLRVDAGIISKVAISKTNSFKYFKDKSSPINILNVSLKSDQDPAKIKIQ